MSYPSGRYAQLRWLQTVVCVAAVVGAFLLLSLGVLGFGSQVNVWMMAAGGFLLFLAIMMMTFAPILLKIESNLSRQLDELRDLQDLVDRQAKTLAMIEEHTSISDAAKSLAHRYQEIEALRGIIRDEIRNEHWESALNLVDEMERRFGTKVEADRIREELDDARREMVQTKLNRAIDLVESHFRTHEWERAKQEIDRLAKALPDDAKVLALYDRMKLMQERHKEALKTAWQEAVRRSDTDHAIDILKELDQYLSPAEAQELKDSARHVFKEKLLQLGVQFRFAVTEKRWHDALSIGIEIIREFPNARMATEVREVLDTLKERANTVSETSVGVDVKES